MTTGRKKNVALREQSNVITTFEIYTGIVLVSCKIWKGRNKLLVTLGIRRASSITKRQKMISDNISGTDSGNYSATLGKLCNLSDF